MQRGITRLLIVLCSVCVLSLCATADTVTVGVFSWDLVFEGNSGSFDISNQTGPNSTPAPDTTFPVSSVVCFGSLSLTVDFNNGSSQTFGSSYFTLAGDGLSFDGSAIAMLGRF